MHRGEDEDLDFELIELGSSNSIHDRSQFESKFDFDLPTQAESNTDKVYEIDLYLFAPQSLGINQENYGTENFYADLTQLLRIRTPEVRRPSRTQESPPTHELLRGGKETPLLGGTEGRAHQLLG